MKIQKSDAFSFSLAIIINLIILICIPGLDKVEDVKDKKLKVGLVALEKQKYTSKAKNKAIPNKKKAEKKEILDTTKQDLIEERKRIKREKNLNLMKISKSLKTPSLDLLTSKKSAVNKKLNSIKSDETSYKEQVKLEREDSDGVNKNSSIFNDSKIIDKIASETKDEAIDIKSKNGSGDIEVKEGKVEGLPSGYKLGVEDAEIIAKWDGANKEPIYPEKAELSGMQGTVKVKLDIDANGRVINLIMEKGSGVPEINTAIETIGRTWNIYLSKRGQRIKGKVILEYSFKLKGI